MTISDVLNYYHSGYRFHQITKISTQSFYAWKKRGYIPIVSQMLIERLSEGALKASLEDAKNVE